MKWLVALLFVGVWARHNTSFPLSQWSGVTQPGVFYAQGGLWEAVLCAVLLAIFWETTKGFARALLISGMAVGIIEGLQMAVCRPLVKSMAGVPSGMNVCDHVTGLPITGVVLALEFIITVWFVGKETKKWITRRWISSR